MQNKYGIRYILAIMVPCVVNNYTFCAALYKAILSQYPSIAGVLNAITNVHATPIYVLIQGEIFMLLLMCYYYNNIYCEWIKHWTNHSLLVVMTVLINNSHAQLQYWSWMSMLCILNYIQKQ